VTHQALNDLLKLFHLLIQVLSRLVLPFLLLGSCFFSALFRAVSAYLWLCVSFGRANIARLSWLLFSQFDTWRVWTEFGLS